MEDIIIKSSEDQCNICFIKSYNINELGKNLYNECNLKFVKMIMKFNH